MAGKSPQEENEERLAEWDKENLRSLLKAKWGLGFLWRLIDKCYVFRDPTVFGNSDATYYNLGKQAVGKELLTRILDIDPNAYIEMTKIAKKERKEADEALEREKKYREAQGDKNEEN